MDLADGVDASRRGHGPILTRRHESERTVSTPADLKKRESDAEKLAALIAAQTPSTVRGKKIIVLDPGHGGKDPGARGVAPTLVFRPFSFIDGLTWIAITATNSIEVTPGAF